MTWSVQHGFAWLGGRERADLAATGAKRHEWAGLTGLAVVLSSVAGFFGWWLWLLGDAQPLPGALAFVATLLTAFMFRQLARASEDVAATAQRVAVQLTAALFLVPGALLAKNELPWVLFQSRIEAHAQSVAARARETQAASAQRMARIERLRTAYTARQRKQNKLEPARLAWEQTIDRSRGAADRCNHVLRNWRQSMPQPPYYPNQIAIFQTLEDQAAECTRLQQVAEQVTGRYEQSFAHKLAVARVAAEKARLQLEHAERSHAAALRAGHDAKVGGARQCLPFLDCRLQQATWSGAVGGFEAWGTAIALMFLALLPALLLGLLPPDAIGHERRLKAIERALLRSMMGNSARQS